MYLTESYLTYGGPNRYPVIPSKQFNIPRVFNFDYPIDCAIDALKVMSQASGGHMLRDCRVIIHRGRKTATVSANGCIVRYRPHDLPGLTAVQAVLILDESETYEIGLVDKRGFVPQTPLPQPAPVTRVRRWRKEQA